MDADFEDDTDMLSYCLVGMSGGDNMFEMHRLLQFSMKKWLGQHGNLNTTSICSRSFSDLESLQALD